MYNCMTRSRVASELLQRLNSSPIISFLLRSIDDEASDIIKYDEEGPGTSRGKVIYIYIVYPVFSHYRSISAELNILSDAFRASQAKKTRMLTIPDSFRSPLTVWGAI